MRSQPRFIHVELPSGGMASVSETASPELIAALDDMVRVAAAAVSTDTERGDQMSTAPAIFKTAQPTRHIDSLRPHPDNPREEIDPEDPTICEMADSIERHGIIEPLVITPDGTVIAGHRRRVAARVAAQRSGRADLMIVPVTLREIAPDAALELMLHENMQRQSLTPLEEARAMYSIMERKKLNLGDMARLISVPVATCSQRVAILKCEPAVQQLYAVNELPLNAAPFLAHVTGEKQINYAGMLARRTITLAKLKDLVREDRPDRVRGATQRATPEGETTANIPKPRPPRPEPGANDQSRMITRAAAEAALNKVLTKKISIHSFRAVLETVCCSCGMKGQSEVCMSCPLPRLVLGVAGRTE